MLIIRSSITGYVQKSYAFSQLRMVYCEETKTVCNRAGFQFFSLDIPFLKNFKLPTGGLFSLSTSSFVGVDIGSDAVKVVQLKRERERAVLETYGELKTARYFQKEGFRGAGGFAGYSDQLIVELLTDVLRESNVTTKHVVFSISSAVSFVTPVTLPFMPKRELAQAVPFEAKKYIPVPIQEVALDWQVTNENQAEQKLELLLAAVPRDIITKYQRISSLLKLELHAIEIESFSLVRSLLGQNRNVVALVNLGGLATTVTIVRQRTLAMNNNLNRGANEITATLARSLSVTEERAEALKREVGLSAKPEEKDIADIIGAYIDTTLADVERAMSSYNRANREKIEKIILTGGGANMAGLSNYVAQRFGLETAVGNPFQRVVFPEFLQSVLKSIAPDFGAAVGLALRQISAE